MERHFRDGVYKGRTLQIDDDEQIEPPSVTHYDPNEYNSSEDHDYQHPDYGNYTPSSLDDDRKVSQKYVSVTDEQRMAIIENHQLEIRSSFLKIADNHLQKWDQIGFNVDSTTKVAALISLDSQLESYFGYPSCSDTDCFISGTGYPNAKVVFVARDPSPFDTKNRKAFYGDAMEVLFKKAKTILTPEECYYMYVFPYHIGKERNPDQFEEQIFLQYALRRISIIKPILLVVLGKKPYSYVYAAFDYRKTPTVKQYSDIQRDQLRVKDCIQIEFDKRNIGVLMCPHPFQLKPQAPRTSVVRNNAGEEILPHGTTKPQEQYSGTDFILRSWNDCFSRIDRIINRKRIKGPKIIDRNGQVAIDSVAVMRDGSDFYYNSNAVVAKKRITKKVKLIPVPKNQPKAEAYLQKGVPMKLDFECAIKDLTTKKKRRRIRKKKKDGSDKQKHNKNKRKKKELEDDISQTKISAFFVQKSLN